MRARARDVRVPACALAPCTVASWGGPRPTERVVRSELRNSATNGVRVGKASEGKPSSGPIAPRPPPCAHRVGDIDAVRRASRVGKLVKRTEVGDHDPESAGPHPSTVAPLLQYPTDSSLGGQHQPGQIVL
jgi:hypothetical protein